MSGPENIVPDDVKDNNLGQPETPTYQVLDKDLTTDDIRPATIVEALMLSAPYTVLAESFEEKAPLIEEVRKVQAKTSAEDRYVLDAISVEGVTFVELSARLGVGSSQAHRLYHAALGRLKNLLLASQMVREHVGLDLTWENACSNEILAITHCQLPDFGDECVDSVVLIEECFGYAVEDYKRNFLLEAEDTLTELARYSMISLEKLGKWNLDKQVELMAQKHHDYGVDNINHFGQFGVIVRLSDKVARLVNLTANNAAPRNESVVDTHRDIIGYVAIYRMLSAVVFNLPQHGVN